MDLDAELGAGRAAAALYHTAGKGTRLAPLPGAEANNKPGVQLAAPAGGAAGAAAGGPLLTILEAVIKQTGVYAASRGGRLSVFWGDQVFVPSVAAGRAPAAAHADILCKLIPMPSAEEWAAQGLEKYGLLAVGADGSAAQVEKVDHATATTMLASLGEIQQVGTSLGSFSVSHALLALLLEEFAPELARKEGKLDSDPHLWMPLTLAAADYVRLMGTKGVAEAEARAHHERIAGLAARLAQAGGGLRTLGAVDVGADAYWWDYGQLKLYLANNALIAGTSAEAAVYRRFLGLGEQRVAGSSLGTTEVAAESCVVQGCALGGGRVAAGAVLAGVSAGEVLAGEGALLVGVAAPRVVAGAGALAYNVVLEEGELVLGEGEVAAGVMRADGTQLLMRSSGATDGGKAWKVRLEANTHSFEEVYELNAGADVGEIEAVRAEKRAQAVAKILGGEAAPPAEKRAKTS